MGFGAPNPGIWGDSVRKALNPGEERGAHDHATGAEQEMLDRADLQEFERTGVYGEPPQAQETPEPPQRSGLRGFFARLFHHAA